MMSEDELTELIEKAETNWQESSQGNPKGRDWGFFSYGDAPVQSAVEWAYSSGSLHVTTCLNS